MGIVDSGPATRAVATVGGCAMAAAQSVAPGSVKADEHMQETKESEVEAVRQVVERGKAPSCGELELRGCHGGFTRKNIRGESGAKPEQHEEGRGAS